MPSRSSKLSVSQRRPAILAWPAWRRVLAVLPVIALLWLAVAWAGLEAAPW